MKAIPDLDRRPILVAVAGPNGAGKTTFYESHLKIAGLKYIEADAIAEQFAIDPYEAAKMADALRRKLVERKESFAFETVFSDPVGEKRKFLRDAAASGYTVLLCFIAIETVDISEARVAMRVSKGGHDVPSDKLNARFPRILDNLKAAIHELPLVYIFDNTDLSDPFRKAAVFKDGRLTSEAEKLPLWLHRELL